MEKQVMDYCCVSGCQMGPSTLGKARSTRQSSSLLSVLLGGLFARPYHVACLRFVQQGRHPLPHHYRFYGGSDGARGSLTVYSSPSPSLSASRTYTRRPSLLQVFEDALPSAQASALLLHEKVHHPCSTMMQRSTIPEQCPVSLQSRLIVLLKQREPGTLSRRFHLLCFEIL